MNRMSPQTSDRRQFRGDTPQETAARRRRGLMDAFARATGLPELFPGRGDSWVD